LRSDQISALGMPSINLDFVMSCRCQVVGNSLQPGGVMLIRHLHEVDNIWHVGPTMHGYKGDGGKSVEPEATIFARDTSAGTAGGS
jgi:hypothetical protein